MLFYMMILAVILRDCWRNLGERKGVFGRWGLVRMRLIVGEDLICDLLIVRDSDALMKGNTQRSQNSIL